MLKRFVCVWMLICCAPALAATTYLPQAQFLKQSFSSTPAAKVHWLSAEDRAVAKKILGHDFSGVRVRYWQQGARTAWVLDEIGKERPITFGVVVADGKIKSSHVLTYRESRGHEIHSKAFMRQFVGGSIDSNYRFSNQVDGISGATMSVTASTKVAQLALYFDSRVN